MIKQRFADLFAKGAQVSLEIAEREIVLTYVLKILDDAGLLKRLAFKGGTCLRKCVYGKETRFSVDLDFTSADNIEADDVILGMVSALGKPAYDLSFQVDTKDFYVAEDRLSCGANIGYTHGTKGSSNLRSAFERPLPCRRPLKSQGYFKYLEFPAFSVPCLQFEELLPFL